MNMDGIDKTKTLIGGIAAISFVMWLTCKAMNCKNVPAAVPLGWRYASPVPEDLTDKCVSLLTQDYGHSEYFTALNGITYFLRVEDHYDAVRGHHKGVTAYQRT